MSQVTFDRTRALELVAQAREDDERMTPGPWEEYSSTCCPDMGGVTSDDREPVKACLSRYGHPMLLRDAEGVARTRNNLRALADQLEAACEEVDDWRARIAKADESFVDAWKVMESRGFQYGHDALENVELGWELAIDKVNAAAAERDAARAEVERLRASDDLVNLIRVEKLTAEVERLRARLAVLEPVFATAFEWRDTWRHRLPFGDEAKAVALVDAVDAALAKLEPGEGES